MTIEEWIERLYELASKSRTGPSLFYTCAGRAPRAQISRRGDLARQQYEAHVTTAGGIELYENGDTVDDACERMATRIAEAYRAITDEGAAVRAYAATLTPMREFDE